MKDRIRCCARRFIKSTSSIFLRVIYSTSFKTFKFTWESESPIQPGKPLQQVPEEKSKFSSAEKFKEECSSSVYIFY